MHTVFSLRLLYTGLKWTRRITGECSRRYKIKLHNKSVNCTSYILRMYITQYVEIKCQLDATEVFIADLIACSICLGHHYAHH